jgi:D-alanyl-D-alanine carboxypeptidase
MLLLGKAMLSRGGGILRAETAGAALTPFKAPDGSPLPVGLGWHLGNLGGVPYANHLGGGGGFRSELRIYPRLNYAVAVVGNETSFDTGSFTQLAVRVPRR